MTTDKYNLETYAYSVSDKSAIATANAEKLDDNIHSRLLATYGEAIDEYEAVYLKSDGKYWLAQEGVTGSCMGIAVDSGIADDSCRIQRIGPITNDSWTWTTPGSYVYVDQTTPGALTETQPTSDAQAIGIVLSTTSILICIGSLPGGPQPYDIPIMYNGSPTSSEVLMRIEMVRPVTFLADLPLSRLTALTAATAEAVFSLKKDGTEFGTMTFAASGTSATIAAASSTSFVDGEILTIVAPTIADSTLSDIYGMLVGSRY